MVGMTGGSALSDYRSRSVVIEVAGMANPTISRVSNYQIKVPFSQMSAAMHTIACQGGRVVKVDVQGEQPQEAVQLPSSEPSTTQSRKKKASPKKKNIISRLTNRKGRRSKKSK